MSKKTIPVLGWDRLQASAAIEVPEIMHSPDGRVFHVQTWKPCVPMDGQVTAWVEVLIEVPEDSAAENIESRRGESGIPASVAAELTSPETKQRLKKFNERNQIK